MNNWNQPFNVPPIGQWPTPAQPQFFPPWQYNAPTPYYQPPPRGHGTNFFLFFSSLWLAGKALTNYQRALEAERRLELMESKPSNSDRPVRAASVIPDFYEIPSPGTTASQDSPTVAKSPGASPMPPKVSIREVLRARIIDAVFGDGMFLVGVDIEPGTYRCDGMPDRGTSWQRCRSASGEMRDVIASHFGRGQCYVTVKEGEFFYSEWSGGWTRVFIDDQVIDGETDVLH
jgi:hypothetical protein